MNGAPGRVDVIGVGFGATVQIPAYQSEGADVTAVCTRRPAPSSMAPYTLILTPAYLPFISLAGVRPLSDPNHCPRPQHLSIRVGYGSVGWSTTPLPLMSCLVLDTGVGGTTQPRSW